MGAYLHLRVSNGKPELVVVPWTNSESGQSRGGVPYDLPDAVSALIMDQRTRPFPKVSTSRPQNHARPPAGALSSNYNYQNH